MAFSPINKSSLVASRLDTTMKNTFTYSAWVRPLNQIVIPVQGQNGYEVQGARNNTCVIHPIHGLSYGNESGSAGSGLYVGTNGLYVEEHSAGWEAVPINYQGDLSGWHLIHIVYENKVPSLYIDGKFVKTGISSTRNIYASLGQDQFPTYNRGGIGAGYPEASQFFNGDIDEVMYFKRALFPKEINTLYTGFNSIKWSTGDTTGKILVNPSLTTKYYVTVSDGINSCQDSVTVNVVDGSAINTLSDTTRICGNSATLTAGNEFDSFVWNTGATTQTITPTSSGFYKVFGTKGACSVSDSTYLSLVQAKILQRDTTICKGNSIILSTSTSNSSISACTSTQLPANLQNGLMAYYPFCGNANDLSGNGNNGVVNGATLTKDRFGLSNSAYSFNGVSNFIRVPNSTSISIQNSFTISTWIYMQGGGCNPRVLEVNSVLNSCGGYTLAVNGNSNISRTIHAASFGSCSNALGFNPTQAITSLTWHHLAFTVDANTGVGNFYLDGQLIQTKTGYVAQPFSYNGNALTIGNINASRCDWWGGMIDDVMLYNRALTSNEIQSLYTSQNSVTWSTGATSNSITVTPTQTTKYYVTVSDGITTCTDSILVKVDDLSSFNPLPDTISQCGKNILLDAGTKYSSYSWSNGDTTPSIQVNMGGRYFVAINDSIGCSASDSTYLSLVNANILQSDTIICNGGSITLSVDTVFKVINTYGTTLPSNLKNDLVAYYPFNGNANDESGNGNNATVFNAKLTTDRFGRPNSAYSFSPANRSSIVAGVLNKTMVNSFTYSVWVRPLNTIVVPAQGQSSNAASGFPNNTCVIHPIHGQNYGPPNSNTGTGVYVGTNGVYLEEHSDGWEAVPISHQMDLSGWHLINIVYENKVPTLYIDGVFIKKGFSSSRQIYASLGPDNYPIYVRSGIGAGYLPTSGTTQYFNGDIDDIFYYKRALNANEVNQIYNGSLNIKWSTGDTTSSIKVNPSVTTKYFVTVSDGITSCTDSILVKVSNLSTFNPFPDTLSQCGKSLNLDAGGSYSSYKWNNGASTKAITVNKSGYYNVNVTDADGCLASDTTLVSLVYVNIDNSDTTVCALANITLKISDTLVSQKGGWELLIPSSSFNFSETNFREGGFDPENAKLYSVFKNGSVNRFYVFDLNQNTVQSVGSLGAPSELYDYVYDFTNSRIIATRVGRDRMYTIPLTGGTWTPFGNGSFDAESYGCATFWNPVSKQPGFFGGYGFFSVKNWVWENNGNAGWQNVFANTNNCQPPKRTGQIARNKLGDKIYIFSGQGSCDGNQFATSCSISQPWATDVGIYCWLKDLWELDLNSYTFKNILPPNSPSIINEGAFTYDYNNDVFYNVGGYKPLPAFSSSATANIDYGVEVYRFRRGVDNGFELMPVDGIKPPVLKLSQYSGRTYYDAKNNRVIWARNDGIWALNLGASSSASYKYKWSTGDTTTTINVSPTQTTTYYVSVTDGITTCKDSIKVTVEQPARGIRYPTQDLIINRPATLNARTFGRTYLWSPDVQLNSPRLITPIITPAKQQQYTVTITTAGGCVTVDSVLVRVFPNINIYVPDGFSPDGDGRNDKLYPIPIGIREIRMFRVFNRWGTLVYDNKNANVNTGWDGTYLRSAQPMESYVWIAEGIDNDGNFIRRTGNTILIR